MQPAHKSMRGVPETVYGELKKITSFSLTPTAYEKLKQLSQELNLSASELLERLARKETEVRRLFEPEVKPDGTFTDEP